MAIAALILGILALLSSGAPFAGIGLGIVAIILGILGRKKLVLEGRKTGAAVAGIVLGALALAGNTVLTVACLACGAAVAAADPSPTTTSSLLDTAAASALTPGAVAAGPVRRCDLSAQPARMCTEHRLGAGASEDAAQESCRFGQIGVPEGSRIGLTDGACPTEGAIARCVSSFGGSTHVYYRDPDPAIDNDMAMAPMEGLCVGTFTRL